ncbi:tautomerase family protein [Paenibacillus sp. P25]|nr:tautomerase family protein [Paenibacillus sp. P25]
MPLLRFDLIEGRDKASLKKLLDVVHTVVVEVFDVPRVTVTKLFMNTRQNI